MLNLTAGGLSGGYKKYLQHVVPLLRAEGSISELLVAVPPGHEQQSGVGTGAWTWNANEPLRGFPGLRDRVRAWKPDVVYIPTARYINCQAPTVCMVQNMLPMIPATLQDGLAAWAKLRVDAGLAKYATRNATRVIAVSEYVREFLVTRWDVPANRIAVVYHGVDALTSVYAPRTLQSRALQSESLQPESPPWMTESPFVFTAGSLFSYRGLEDAIRALPLLADTRTRLVIAGTGSARYLAQMQSLARALNVSDRVVWLGQIGPDAVMSAYQQCLAFVMTSRVEACPNIALEAMASGARCISTSCPPMPEFFAEHALYYVPDDAATLASHINAVAGASAGASADAVAGATSAQLSHLNAQHRAAHYTWENTMHGVITQLKAAVNNNG